jgi:hypothetical protein
VIFAKGQVVEAAMNDGICADGTLKATTGSGVIRWAALFLGVMALASVAAAAKSGEENRVVNYHAVDRAQIENLQRWVAAGHEAWCKDPRLLAAEDLRRIAADVADGAAD